MTNAEKAAMLKKARALIAVPEHWCQGYFSRDARGDDTDPDGEDAARWCISGATQAVAGPIVSYWLDAELRGNSNTGLEDWNDDEERTHDEVLALFDSTIARLEAAT